MTKKETIRNIGLAFLSFLICVMNGGIFYCNGFFFSEFVTRLGAGRVIVSSLASIQTSLCMTTGLFGPYLLRVFGYKNIIILGSMMIAVGLAASSFANDVLLLFPCFAIIPGIGLGFQMFAAILVNQHIFAKHRALVFGIVLSGSSVGVFIFGFVVETLLRVYGWRGTLLMLSAIVFHAVPMAMCMTVNQNVNRRKDPSETVHKEDKTEANISPDICSSQTIPDSQTAQCKELCKNKLFFVTLVAMFLVNFGGSVAGVFLPHYVRLNYGEYTFSGQSISCISTLGAGDFCGRILAALIGNWLPASKLSMILFDALLLGISYIMIPFCSSYTLVLCCTFFVGIALGFFVSIVPSNMIDLFGIENLNRAYGMATPVGGLAFLLSAPFHAFLVDCTEGQIYVVFISAGTCGLTTSLVVFLSCLCSRKL